MLEEYKQKRLRELGKLLDDILASETVEKGRKERDIQDEIEFYGRRDRLVDFEVELIADFFDDYEEALKTISVWEWLKSQLKGTIDDLFLDAETFLADMHLNLESEMIKKFEYLCEDLQRLLRERHRKFWQALTLEDAERRLSKEKGTFIVLLDKDGKCLDEPYPVWANPEATVTVKPDLEAILVQLDPIPEHHGHKIPVIHICEKTEDLAKVEVLTFP